MQISHFEGWSIILFGLDSKSTMPTTFFKKAQSGNPKGRRPGITDRRGMLREALR